MCLMSNPRGCVSVMVYRALHAPRVPVFLFLKYAGKLCMFPLGENISLVYVPIGVVVTYGYTVVPRGGGSICNVHLVYILNVSGLQALW